MTNGDLMFFFFFNEIYLWKMCFFLGDLPMENCDLMFFFYGIYL